MDLTLFGCYVLEFRILIVYWNEMIRENNPKIIEIPDNRCKINRQMFEGQVEHMILYYWGFRYDECNFSITKLVLVEFDMRV